MARPKKECPQKSQWGVGGTVDTCKDQSKKIFNPHKCTVEFHYSFNSHFLVLTRRMNIFSAAYWTFIPLLKDACFHCLWINVHFWCVLFLLKFFRFKVTKSMRLFPFRHLLWLFVSVFIWEGLLYPKSLYLHRLPSSRICVDVAFVLVVHWTCVALRFGFWWV